MKSYTALASKYDELTRDVDYRSWVEFYKKLFAANDIGPKSVLDLGCGTGSLTMLMAQNGYDMIGVDGSEDMLAQAAQKLYSGDLPEKMPMFLCQKFENLDLYGTVDAAISSLDCINYITEPKTLDKVFSRLKFFVRPGGIFIFDVNSEYKFTSMDKQVFVDETEDVLCIWRTDYSKNTRLCSYVLDLFTEKNGMWMRSTEEHSEYFYTLEELEKLLNKNCFKNVRFYGNRKLGLPSDTDDRIFVSAIRE